MVLCVQCSKPISGDHNRCLSFSHSITKSVMPANPPVFTESKATTYVVLPEFLQKCPESRASLTSALPALTLQPLHASQLCLEWPFSCSKSKMKAQSGLVVLMIREQAMRRKTEQEAWGSGPGDLHQSPLRVQLLALITDYRVPLILSFPRHYTDMAPISLLLPQAVPSWALSGTTASAQAAFMPDADPLFQGPYFTSQSSSLLGLAVGFVTRRLFLRKTWKIIINTVS